MKIRSHYALILLLSCISPVTSIHTKNEDEHRERAGSVIEATSVAQLNDIIANNALVVVDFYASWCGPCKKMAPEFAKLPGAFSDVVFVKISVDLSGVTDTFKIKSMPTLICYKNGQQVARTAGAKTFNDLKNYVIATFNN